MRANGRCQNCSTPLPPSDGGRPRLWCSERCRKRKYDLACVDCGGRVDGTTPGKMPDRDRPVCIACRSAHYRVWTPDAVLVAIRKWADDNGGIPPTAESFRRAKRNGRHVPTTNYVIQQFGTWNAAIVAAGFEPHHSGPLGGFTPLTPFQRRQCARRYAAGDSSIDIAADFGCSPQVVIKWARSAGVTIRPPFSERRAA